MTRVRAARAAPPVLLCIASVLVSMCGQAPPGPAPRETVSPDAAAYEVHEVASGGGVAGVATLAVPPALRERAQSAGVPHQGGHAVPAETRRASGLSGLLPDVVVYLADIRRGRAFDERPPTALLNQRDMQFEPRIQLVQPGTTLAILNSDPTSHNVRGIHDETRETLFNYAMPLQHQRLQVPLERPGRVNVMCDMKHGWMKATLIVMRHPYYAVTDAQGRFELPRVPPGEYSVRAWHDAFGEQTLKVHVSPATTTRVMFSFSIL